MDDIEMELEKFVKARLIPADRNALYKRLVREMYAECDGSIHKQALNDMKNDALNILLNLVKYAFSSGMVEGFKKGVDIAGGYVPIIRKQSEKIGHKKISSKGGKASSSRYNIQMDIAENVYVVFKQKHPELVEIFQQNPKANKPKTLLKNMIYVEMGGISPADRTLSNWAKKLLETDGTIKVRI